MDDSPTKDGRLSGSENTRAALLRAGEQLFARHGFQGAGLSALTREAKANKAAVSYHFGGKRGLYDAVLDQSGKRFAGLFDELIARDPNDDLDGFMAHVWSRIRAESTHARIVLRAVLDDGRPPENVVWMRAERLPEACARVAPLFGVAPQRLRLIAVALNLLASRFAVVDDDELCALTGAADIEAANRVVVELLTDVARSYLADQQRSAGEG